MLTGMKGESRVQEEDGWHSPQLSSSWLSPWAKGSSGEIDQVIWSCPLTDGLVSLEVVSETRARGDEMKERRVMKRM